MDDIFEMPRLNPAQLSLNDFLMQIQVYRADIMRTHSQVERAYSLFGQSGIWADQIDRAICAMQKMNESVQEFCELLSSLAFLPNIVGPLRYPLMKMLYQIDVLISDIVGQLTLFRPGCRSSSKKAATQRQEIQQMLESLLQCLEQLNQTIEVLPERIAIQEKIFANA